MALRSKTFKWLMGLIGALLFLVAAAVITIWILINNGQIKSAVENLVSVATERTLRINGDFDLEFGQITSLRATEIEWMNPAWSSHPLMLKLEEFDVAIDIRSIFEPPILITRARAVNGTLLLEWTEQDFNWALGNADDEPDAESGPLQLLLDQAELDNIQLQVIHPALTENLTIHIRQAKQQQDAEQHLVLDIDSVFDGRPVTLSGRLGPFPELINAGAVEFDLKAAGPYGNIVSNGSVENLGEMTKPELEFQIKAPETAVVFDMLNLPTITSGPSDLTAHVHTQSGSVFADAKGTIGEFSIQADIKSDQPGTFNDLAVDLTSSGPNAGVLARLAEINGVPDLPYTLKLKFSTKGNGLTIDDLDYSTQELKVGASGEIHNFPDLRDFDINFSVVGDSLSTYNELAGGTTLPDLPFSIEGKTESNGAATSDSAKATASLGTLQLTLDGSLSEKPDFADSAFAFGINIPDLQDFSSITNLQLSRATPVAAEGKLAFDGKLLTLTDTSASVSADRITAYAKFPVEDPTSNIQGHFKLSGDNLATLASLPKSETPPTVPALPFEFEGDVELNGNNIKIDSGRARIGQTDLKFSGTVNAADPAPVINAVIDAKGTNLAELLKGQGIEGLPAGAFQLSAKVDASASGAKFSDIDFRVLDSRLQGSLTSQWPDHPERIVFDVNASGSSLSKTLPDIVNYKAQDKPFEVTAKGSIDESEVRVESGRFKVGSANATMTGTLHLQPKLRGKGIQFSAEGQSLADLGRINNMTLAAKPFLIKASIDGTETTIRADDMIVRSGKSELIGKFNLEDKARPVINANITSKYFDLSDFIVPEEPAKKTAATKATAPVTRKTRILPNDPLPVGWLNDFDGAVRLNVATMKTTARVVSDIIVDATLKDGALVSNEITAKSDDGFISGALSLRPIKDKIEVQMELDAKDIVVAFREMTAAQKKLQPKFKIDASLTAQGATISELGADLNGFFWARTPGGQIPLIEFGGFMGDFASQVLNTVNPFVKKRALTQVVCEGIYLEAINGVVSTAPASVFVTEDVIIGATGNVDLNSEKINMVIQTNPAKGIGVSASDLINPFTKIGGTLSKPVLVLDPVNTVIEGGAAVATGGLSILAKGLWKRWVSSRNICDKVEEEARQFRTERDPAKVPL